MVRLFILLFASLVSFYSYSMTWQSFTKTTTIYPSELTEYTCAAASVVAKRNAISSFPSPTYSVKYIENSCTPSTTSFKFYINYTIYYLNMSGQECADGQILPEYPDTQCKDPSEPEPEPHSCPDSGTFFKRLNGGKSIAGFSTCLPENCVVAIQKPTPQVCIAFGGGGGGAGNGITDGLGEIACLLDETCEGGGSKSSVTENKCESFKCDGEAVVCYLARKEWAKTCDVEDFLAEGGAGSEFASGINQFIDENPMEHLEAGNFDVTSVMNKYTNGNGFEVNSGCPAPRNVDVGFTSIVIEYQMFCDLAVIINWFLISFSLVSAALLIAKYGL
ncbi:TPA: virulence factor TspB C-terminal domain-related protein [Vibrio parahaemolyticus]